METKICRKCNIEQPISEYRVETRNTIKKGVVSYHRKDCKTCEKEYMRNRYKSDPEHIIEIVRRHARKYPDRTKERLAKWQKSHREHCLNYSRNYNEANREKRQAYHEANREKRKAYNREYARNHPHGVQEKQARRRARKSKVSFDARVSRKKVIERDNSTCYLCKKILERTEIVFDHVLPIARGGAHSFENLKVSCALCNARKGAKTLEEYYSYCVENHIPL